MFLLNEFIEPIPNFYLATKFIHESDVVPFKKGDVVCIVDSEISMFRNFDELNKRATKEKRIKTLFENVNRRGEITEIKITLFKRKKGLLHFKAVRIKVRFPGDLFVEIGNHSFIRTVN